MEKAVSETMTLLGVFFICLLGLSNVTSWTEGDSVNFNVANPMSLRVDKNGKSEVPDGRPPFENRTFVSPTVEQVLVDVGSRIKDATIRQIFENCYPNTLDTTINWHRPRGVDIPWPYTYVITGDIKAMWLRDSAFQVYPYIPLGKTDAQIRELILGLINTQAEMITLYPHGNAFLALDHWESQLPHEPNEWAANDTVYPNYNSTQVFEAKFELDSLASFLCLVARFYEETGNSDFLDNLKFILALESVLKTMKDMQGGTIEVFRNEPYNFTRPTRSASETQNLYGRGNPVKRCGLIRSFFRPSDDSTIFQYLIPSNAMAVVGLRGVATVLSKVGGNLDLAFQMALLAEEVDAAIKKYGIVQHSEFGSVYAFEVDGYGSHVFMDDAGFPSLLSLPYLNYTTVEDQVYLNTRKYILSSEWNPYYTIGKYPGGSSPHASLQKTWPMALTMQGLTSQNETEIYNMLWTLRNTTGGTGFMHETFDVDNPNNYTRPWFAWANSVFGEFIVHLDKEYPHLLE